MPSIPDRLPLFTLPNLVLLPGADLPLRVYDPEQQRMLEDVIDKNRMLVVCQMMNAWEEGTKRAPKLYPYGTVALIIAHHELKDNGISVFIRGLQKVEVGEYLSMFPYKIVKVAATGDGEEEPDMETVLKMRDDILTKLYQGSAQEVLDPFPPGALERMSQSSSSNFVALTATLLGLAPHEHQKLLERDGLIDRLYGLTEMINMILLKKATLGDGSFNDDGGGYTH